MAALMGGSSILCCMLCAVHDGGGDRDESMIKDRIGCEALGLGYVENGSFGMT
jgi:hypothetical protein